jgi:hypothetical protein
MVRREVRGRAEGQAEGGLRATRTVIRLVDLPDPTVYPLTRGMRRVCNAYSGEPSEVSDGEVNAHLGNPGSVGIWER